MELRSSKVKRNDDLLKFHSSKKSKPSQNIQEKIKPIYSIIKFLTNCKEISVDINDEIYPKLLNLVAKNLLPFSELKIKWQDYELLNKKSTKIFSAIKNSEFVEKIKFHPKYMVSNLVLKERLSAHTKFTDELCKSISKSKFLKKIVIQQPGCCEFSNAWKTVFENCKDIEQFVISKSTLFNKESYYDTDIASIFIEMGKLHRLQKLGLIGYPLGPESIINLADLIIKLSGLKYLNLTECNLGNESVALICKSISKGIPKNLTHLNLSSNNIGPSGCEKICELLVECTKLKKLDLSCNEITDKSIVPILKILSENHFNLQKICINNTKITEISLFTLANISKNIINLKCLSLSGNKFNNEKCVNYIAEIMKNLSKLKELGLGHCEIQKGSGIIIAQSLGNLKNLKRLNLARNKLRAKDIEAINNSAKLHKIDANLILPLNRISYKEYRLLRNMPDLSNSYDSNNENSESDNQSENEFQTKLDIGFLSECENEEAFSDEDWDYGWDQ